MPKVVRPHVKKSKPAAAAAAVPQVAGGGEIGSLPFDYHARTRLVFGMNSVERVGELAREMGPKKFYW